MKLFLGNSAQQQPILHSKPGHVLSFGRKHMDSSNKNEKFKKQLYVLRSSDCHLKILLKPHERLTQATSNQLPNGYSKPSEHFNPYFCNCYSKVTVKACTNILNQRVFLVSPTWSARQTESTMAVVLSDTTLTEVRGNLVSTSALSFQELVVSPVQVTSMLFWCCPWFLSSRSPEDCSVAFAQRRCSRLWKSWQLPTAIIN